MKSFEILDQERCVLGDKIRLLPFGFENKTLQNTISYGNIKKKFHEQILYAIDILRVYN